MKKLDLLYLAVGLNSTQFHKNQAVFRFALYVIGAVDASQWVACMGRARYAARCALLQWPERGAGKSCLLSPRLRRCVRPPAVKMAINLGAKFAGAAAATHVLAMLCMFMAYKIDSPGDDDPWKVKYPERQDMAKAMGNFGGDWNSHSSAHHGTCVVGCIPMGADNTTACEEGCSDAVNLIQARVKIMADLQPILVFK